MGVAGVVVVAWVGRPLHCGVLRGRRGGEGRGESPGAGEVAPAVLCDSGQGHARRVGSGRGEAGAQLGAAGAKRRGQSRVGRAQKGGVGRGNVW